MKQDSGSAAMMTDPLSHSKTSLTLWQADAEQALRAALLKHHFKLGYAASHAAALK
jgi:hypothetical protein